MNLKQLQKEWKDTPDYHKGIHELFCELVNKEPELKEHRDWVENAIWGFGERSFWWLWLLILAELDESPTMTEIGVFRGATVCLWRLLKPKANIFAISPLDSSGDYWISDYAADVKQIHYKYDLQQPLILKGRSDEPKIVEAAGSFFHDVIYVDGSHEYVDALFDLNTYCLFVKPGGYLVIDDCNCDMDMPFGFFQGKQEVTEAKKEWLNGLGQQFEFIFSVVHISVFKRI